MSRQSVEVLVLEGCPHTTLAIERARAAFAAMEPPPELRVLVVDHGSAHSLAFLGSPTVRVDGVDVEPGAVGRSDFGMQCRVYPVAGGVEKAPLVEWIAAALRAGGGQ
jgi:hypothetical protein